MDTSLSDIAAVTNGGGLGGNNSFLWIIALLMIFWSGNGNFGFGNNSAVSRTATVEDLNNTTNFTRLENQVMNNGNLVETKVDSVQTAMQTGFNDIGNGICSLGYDLQAQLGNLKYDNLAQTSALSTQVADANCKTTSMIMENRYLNANEMASQTAQILAGIQSVKDQISEDKIASLQAQVSKLETQNMFCGVPKINPYFYGVYPYNAGFGGNTNI